MKRIIFFLLIVISFQSSAQKKEDQNIAYDKIYDDPDNIYKLWIGFQPLYADFFNTNLNAGFGGQANYYLGKKFDFRANVRKSYHQKADLNRYLAQENNDSDKNVINGNDMRFKPYTFNYYEFGGTYHFRDEKKTGTTKIVLYSKKNKRWQSEVPEIFRVFDSEIRHIKGIRLGGIIYDTSYDLKRAMFKQGVTISTADGAQTINHESGYIYGNLNAQIVYLGASYAKIRNIAVKPDKTYGNLINDLMLTTYADLLIAPNISLQNVQVGPDVFDVSSIKTRKVGFRAGVDGLFNREFGWGYGAEIGYRPSIQSGGFYMLLKIGFPVWALNLDREKEAFGK